MDLLLRRIVQLVEDKGFEEVRISVRVASGDTVSGTVVPSSFALTPIAENHIGLAEVLLEDDESDFSEALTMRVAGAGSETVIRLQLESVCWWSLLYDPIHPM